jgi:hypothetical protein
VTGITRPARDTIIPLSTAPPQPPIHPFRALCVTSDPQLRRALRRTLQASGSIVDIVDAAGLPAALAADTPPDLVVVDHHTRHQVDLGSLTGEVIIVGESLAHADVIALLRARGLNHVLGGASGEDEVALVVTSSKMRQGDLFGLEKYLAWGAFVHERAVATYDEKRNALLDLADYAGQVGARRAIVARVESVADELLMNALYDAPAARHGAVADIQSRSKAGLGPLGETPARLRYASDDKHLAVSVRDEYGELKKEAILDHLERARAERGVPQSRPTGGAGLGMYFVMQSVTRFIANVSPGKCTEVIALFDIRATGREAESCARSIHVFVAADPHPV